MIKKKYFNTSTLREKVLNPVPGCSPSLEERRHQALEAAAHSVSAARREQWITRMRSAQLTSSTGTQFRSHPQWKWVFPHYLTRSRYSPKGVPTRSSSSWASLKFVRLTVNTHSRPLGLHSPHPVHSEDRSDGWRSSGFSVIVHVRTPSAWLVLVSLMLRISV